MKYLKNGKVIAAVVVVAVVLGLAAMHFLAAPSADRLLLLVPDKTSLKDPGVVMWIDAGNEEGLHVVPMHDSEFLRPFLQKGEFSGVILPDTIHREASDLLVTAIRRFVAGGGNLMLVYDAGTLSLGGRYAPGQSRFSDLAGVKYALYDSLAGKTIQWSKIKGPKAVFDRLSVPPGKYYPFYLPTYNGVHIPQPDVELRRYMYGDLEYPSLTTSGDYSGTPLLHSDAGIVAGEHKFNSGSVLFVNLPLGYLKGNTDGLMLHGFLNYFADHSLGLPRLLPVPDGIGGVTLNWHVDSNAAIKPLQEMETWKILEQGPYSVHITAGPDAMELGDHRGFDADHNAVSQAVIRQYEGLGYSIGSHGGWIHNYFASHVDNGDPKDLQQYLALNKESLERITGKPVTEYSAPDGNQPQWVTQWLEKHGFVAYYFTGDTGMGPTRGYRDGKREGEHIWAFPILHLDRAAAFEEFTTESYPQEEIERWLESVTDFAVNHREVRLVYFHPPGILSYRPVVRPWMEKTAALSTQGKFRWYTMTDLGNFLNARQQVEWKVARQDGQWRITARHPRSLEHETWSLPSDRFSEPKIVAGAGKITKGDDGWLIVAGDTKKLEIQAGILGR